MNRHLNIIDYEVMLRLTSLGPEQNLLDKTFVSYDAGCGTGARIRYLIMLTSDTDIVGIDLSKKALEIAQERC
ncbi:methyltransferase domain-containing protein [cyanobacterium endosymbiont of Rhopalodia gibberula]|uniref:methyltransferase domain-containing protein n=1 Tax=cyanobacterium endosymbiont of Rhopalodia gibberula TaxID=1763363 RepID=UPI001E55618E|nr:class I SAM-dependent methyltransferase [cyanobacterium endosymbiont of Rhopalodia gibberula]